MKTAIDAKPFFIQICQDLNGPHVGAEEGYGIMGIFGSRKEKKTAEDEEHVRYIEGLIAGWRENNPNITQEEIDRRVKAVDTYNDIQDRHRDLFLACIKLFALTNREGLRETANTFDRYDMALAIIKRDLFRLEQAIAENKRLLLDAPE